MKETLLLLCALFVFAGCEKPVIEGEDQGNKTDIVSKGEFRLTFNAMQVEQTPFYAPSKNDGATQNLTEACSRISFVVFDGDKKVSSTHQTSSEKSFGSVSVNLDKGTYTLVIIAHNGLQIPPLRLHPKYPSKTIRLLTHSITVSSLLSKNQRIMT